jgi:hypothetical protein
MELTNHTPYAARLFHGHTAPEEKCAWLVARATFRRDPETGALTAETDDAWPVFDQPLDTAAGTFPSDNVWIREGCDLVVAGTVRLDREVTRHAVHLRAGGFTRSLQLSGDRVWERSARGGLQPTPALPFREMELTWRRSYGGTTSYEGQAAPHALNPDGLGLYWSLEDALEKPLPNIEDPAHAITRWEERPLPAGFGPVTNAPLWHATRWFMERAAQRLPEPTPDELTHASLTFFEGASPPSMIVPSLAPGAVVELTGLGAAPWRFTVPTLPLRVRARVGADEIERPLHVAGVWMLADHDLVVVTARANFRYPMRPRELRGATLETT